MIICGSKPVTEPVDHIVDSFDVIVRHNMLIHGQGYGFKPSTFQVLNCHVWENKGSWPNMFDRYVKSGIVSEAKARAFHEYYMSRPETVFMRVDPKSTKAIQRLYPNVRINKDLRAGFAMIGHCVMHGIRPTLIGYSMEEKDYLRHQIGYAEGKMSPYHDNRVELELLERLIDDGYVDGQYL